MSPKAATYTERVSVFFSTDQMEQIKAESEKIGVPVGVFIRMATLKVVNGNG